MIKALIRHILINQKALRAFNAASQKLYQVLMLNSTDQVHFIKELISPLRCIKEQSLDSNDPPIPENPLLKFNRTFNISLSTLYFCLTRIGHKEDKK